MPRVRRLFALLLPLLPVLTFACSDRPPTTVTVFAAASLTDSFAGIRPPGHEVRPNFAGSQALARQIAQGASADVFASADERSMQTLVRAGLVERPRVFARNLLEIVVAPGNPKGVRGLRDLARADLTVVLEDPAVPAGAYARRALDRAGARVRPASLELDVRAALARVTSGEADAAIVYASDVKAAGPNATGVEIPEEENVIATYPMAVVKASTHKAAARAFVREVLGPSGQQVLRRHGFLPAAGPEGQ